MSFLNNVANSYKNFPGEVKCLVSQIKTKGWKAAYREDFHRIARVALTCMAVLSAAIAVALVVATPLQIIALGAGTSAIIAVLALRIFSISMSVGTSLYLSHLIGRAQRTNP